MSALVLDAHLKSSLATIRSLGRHRIPVIAGSHRRAAMGLHSRYAAETFLYPSPLEDRAAFVDAVARQARRAGKPVLYAFSDSTLLPLIEETAFPASYPGPANPSDFQTAFDKCLTLRLAQSIGLEIPATCFGGGLPSTRYPLVLKPRRSVNWRGNAGVQNSVEYAFSAEEVKRKQAAILERTGEPPLVQELIPGEQCGVEFLCNDGAILAASAHRRLRSLPPAGGAGVVSETIPLSHCGLGVRAERLVAALRWTGPIMVEFRTDPSDGVPRLMEINGRFWGSLPLAIAAGVDFPSLFYSLANGSQAEDVTRHRPGVISRHHLGDLRHLMWVLLERDPMRGPGYPERLRTVSDFLRAPAGSRPEVVDWDDMKPAAMEIVEVVARRFGR